MKIIILLLVSLNLLGSNNLLLKIQSEIPKNFKNGMETILLKSNYQVIDGKLEENDSIDNESLTEQSKSVNANSVIVVKVAFEKEGFLKFSGKFIDFQKEKIITKELLYQIDDEKALQLFGEKFARNLLKESKKIAFFSKEKNIQDSVKNESKEKNIQDKASNESNKKNRDKMESSKKVQDSNHISKKRKIHSSFKKREKIDFNNNYRLGINAALGGSVMVTGISIDVFINENINLELSIPLHPELHELFVVGGIKLYFSDIDIDKFSFYTGLHILFLNTENNDNDFVAYLAFGTQYIFKGGFNFSIDGGLITFPFMGGNIVLPYGGIKAGYRF